MKNLVIIMSGGSGSRLDKKTPKQFLKIGSETILELSIKRFQEHPQIDCIFIVSKKELIKATKKIIEDNNFFKVSKVLEGGSSRQISSRIGVYASGEDNKNILIHDAARPFVSSGLIDRVLSSLRVYNSVIPVLDSTDTLISVGTNNRKIEYINRDRIKRVQTPQGFNREVLLKAHLAAEKEMEEDFTDDCSLIMHYNFSDVVIVEGESSNIKITYRKDLDKTAGLQGVSK